MNHLNTLSIFKFILITSLFITSTYAATFTVKNNCGFTVWGASAIPGGGGPSGGQQMNPGATWTFNANPGVTQARIWARTGCNQNGQNCATGDCGQLRCQGYGQAPSTLAEYALNQFNNLDFFDISLITGFNVPMSFRGSCNAGPVCSANLNPNCPAQLRANGGCNNPCTLSGACNRSDLTQYFKNACPTSYSIPTDDSTSTFTCPTGANYVVTFCP